jgi:very-short-patch-repair endonuclease/DNA-binding transcriptional MerR regulator
MLNEGKYLKDIAQEFGVTHTTISNYIKANGIEKPKSMITSKYVFSDEQLAYISKLCSEGASLRVMAQLMNVDRDVIKRLMDINCFSIDTERTFIMSPLGRKDYKEECKANGIHAIQAGKMYNEILREISEEARKYAILNDLKRDSNTVFLSDEEVQIIKTNINVLNIAEISELAGVSEEKIRQYCRKNGLDSSVGSRRVLPPDTQEFNDDIGNPRLSYTDIARKYNVSFAVAKRWRLERFGDFKTMINTWNHKSSAEIIFEEILEELDIISQYQKKILGWKVDFYLGHKIVVEINGSHWHDELEKVIKKDENKISDLKNAGYNVLIIWDYELDNIDDIKRRVKEIFYETCNCHASGLI